MPVSFEQPSPIGVGIQSAYGATEQYNKTLPVLAGLYESIGRNVNQAAGETARNQTQANISDSDNLARQQSQIASQQFQAQAQQRQIAAEQDHQATQQAFQWATQERAITQSDTMQYAQTQQAVSEIMKMVDAHQITEDEAAPLILKAKTKIDLHEERLKKARAENEEALAQSHLKQAAQQQTVTNMNLGLQAKSTQQNTRTFLDPKMEQEERAKLAPKYNAMAAVMGADAAQQAYDKEVEMNVTAKGGATREVIENYGPTGAAKWRALDKPNNPKANPIVNEFTDKSGGLDMTAVLKDAKAFTERKLGPRPRLTKDSTQDDKDAQQRWDKLVDDRADGIERLQKYPGKSVAERQAAETASQQAGSQSPSPDGSPQSASPDNPSQQAQAANDQRGDTQGDFLSKIGQNTKLDPFERQAATQAAHEVKAIMSKSKPTAEDVARVQTLRKLLGQVVQ